LRLSKGPTYIEPPFRSTRRSTLLILAAITIVGGLLRVYQIDSQGLWLDEAFSIWIARQPLADMFSWMARIDQHPPLYYLLLHFWMRLGQDAGTVRALSALAGVLNIPVLYLLGRRLAGRRVGLLAAAILAVSPFHVRFAQEARMYTWLNLNVSLATLALARLLADGRSTRLPIGYQVIQLCRKWWNRGGSLRSRVRAIETDLAWAAYVACTAAALLTHHVAFLFLLATNLFVFGLAWRRRSRPESARQPGPISLRNWLIAQAGILVLWSPWLKASLTQVTGVYREFWLPPPTWQTVGQALQDLASASLPQRITWAGVIWSLYGGILVLGVLHLRRHPVRLALLATLFLAPFAGELLISVQRPIFYDRTLIWASIPLYLLLAAGIRRLRYRPYVLAALTIVLTINALSLREFWLHSRKEEWNRAAAYVAVRASESDLILFHATWVQIPFDYYFQDSGLLVDEHGVPVDLFARGVLEPKMTASDLPRLRELVQGREQVWLIYSHQWYTDPQGLVPAALEETLDLLERRRFYGLEVRLYGPQRDG
jgi:mannosyltransferase